MSSTESNKMLACLWLELVSAHDIDALCAITSPTWRMHGGPRDLPPGPAGVREMFRIIGPVEQTWTIHEVVGEGEMIVVRATNSCLQDRFLGMPGRGVRQQFTAMFMHRIVDGRVAETWRNADDLARVFQLGTRVFQLGARAEARATAA